MEELEEALDMLDGVAPDGGELLILGDKIPLIPSLINNNETHYLRLHSCQRCCLRPCLSGKSSLSGPYFSLDEPVLHYLPHPQS